jgi:hypothetical protein
MRLFLIHLLLSVVALAQVPNDPSFFANSAIQKMSEEAFVVQAKSIPFLKHQRLALRQDVILLVKSIQSDKALFSAVTSFEKLNLDQKTAVLRRVFAHQIKSLGIAPPALVLDNNFKNDTYFEFDPTKPTTGKVILNPQGLSKMKNPYAPLLFLIHETKHSAQFQMAFSNRTTTSPALTQGYRAAFLAQKNLQGKLSYLDFMTLVNEHDAFQYGNAVVALLTNGKSNDPTMGTFASQFDQAGLPKIDLISLFHKTGPLNFLNAFNELEIEQWKIIRKPK